MRFGTSLPIALFALSIPTLAYTSQTPWKAPSTLYRTLVDALNDDPDYTSLLYLLQRTLLIPTLNKLNGSTLFAPTNDAIAKHASKHPLWQFALEESNDLIPDNRHEQLRQQLFYHLLNVSIPAIPSEQSVSEYETLLYPRKPISPPSKDPPPYPPWMPIPGGTLGGDPQRIRLATRDNSVSIGADFYGKHGVSIVKGLKDAGNGMLLGIGEVLEPPPDLAMVVSQHASLSYFQKIMDSEIVKTLNSTSGMTLFLPTDDAWSVLHPMERLYLESEFSANDMRRILSAHAVVASKGVHWSTSFNGSTKLTTLADTNLDIKKSPENITVGAATLLEPDIYASNGVLHTVSSLLFPEDFLQLTPEKYLLALNCTKFISLLHSVDLTGLINNTDTKYTILAPSDDVLKIFDGPEIPPSGSEELKKLLQYHFIPGHWTPSKLQSGRLLETALQEPGLNGGRQVVPVEVQKDGKKKGEDKTISFGSAGVIGEPIEANNTLIYFVSRPLVPPADALQVALPTLELSTFLAAIFSTDKAERLRTTPSTSLLIPHNKAFERLGLLVSAHLLAPSSKDDLANVILHHALTSVEYASSLENGSQHTFSTLEGSDVKIDRFANGTAHISSSGGWSGLKAELTTLDLLTQTGVIHELSDIMIPRSVQLTIGKLVKAAKGGTMSTLVNKAGFEWVLNGTAPPEGSPWADEKYGNAGWTLLCPPDEAFKNVNLTQLYSDVEGLKDIVSQHLIPMSPMNAKSDGDPDPLYNNRPLVLDDSTYATVRSTSSAYGDIVFQKQAEGEGYIVGIKGARGTSGEEDSARVLAWGRSSTGTGTGGVVQIDRLLVPYRPSWFFMYGAPTIVGGLGMLAICGFFYLVRLVWLRDTTEATYEPVGGFGRDDDDDA